MTGCTCSLRNGRYRGPVASAATPAIAVLVAASVEYDVLRYHHDPRTEAFGDEASTLR